MPELMVAMALQNRMSDTEVISVTGARQYSRINGYGSEFEFGGEDQACLGDHRLPSVVAIDAIRGGGPAMTELAILRDVNKARIAFDGAAEVATGHWGCGAFGNHHDLMFLKQWLAASDAGARKLHYHDFDRKQSHSIVALVRKLGGMSVGELLKFLLELTGDLVPCNMSEFSKRIRDTAHGKP